MTVFKVFATRTIEYEDEYKITKDELIDFLINEEFEDEDEVNEMTDTELVDRLKELCANQDMDEFLLLDSRDLGGDVDIKVNSIYVEDKDKQVCYNRNEDKTMTTLEKPSAVQSMIADNDTLIITDPCYLLTDEDWDKFGRKPYIYDNGQEFLSTLNFGECIIADTGYGDWSNFVVADNGLTLGNFTADAGMVCVLTASDLSNYNFNKEKFEQYVRNGLITIIPNYTGTVELYYEDSDEFGKWAVIQATGDYNWHSIKHR